MLERLTQVYGELRPPEAAGLGARYRRGAAQRDVFCFVFSKKKFLLQSLFIAAWSDLALSAYSAHAFILVKSFGTVRTV